MHGFSLLNGFMVKYQLYLGGLSADILTMDCHQIHMGKLHLKIVRISGQG